MYQSTLILVKRYMSNWEGRGRGGAGGSFCSVEMAHWLLSLVFLVYFLLLTGAKLRWICPSMPFPTESRT